MTDALPPERLADPRSMATPPAVGVAAKLTVPVGAGLLATVAVNVVGCPKTVMGASALSATTDVSGETICVSSMLLV